MDASNSTPPRWRHGLMLALLVGQLVPAFAAAGDDHGAVVLQSCEFRPEVCAFSLVITSAGLPGVSERLDHLRWQFESLQFSRDRLTGWSAASLKDPLRIKEVQELPEGPPQLALKVSARAGLSGKAARASSAARVRSLTSALKEAGYPTDRLQIIANPSR